jgi:hypothetical protein
VARVLIAGLAALLMVAPVAAAKKPFAYRVKMTFTQTRPWTYYHQQRSPDCVRTENGNGIDVVNLGGTANIGIGPIPATGYGDRAREHRAGAETHNVSGSECAPSAVFPSTWRTVTETDGSVTATEANDGCGDKVSTKFSFWTVTLKSGKLKLKWTSAVGPEFNPCPDFEGSNDPSPGNELPGSAFREIAVKVDVAALRHGKKRVVATGTSVASATENCANLMQGCAPDVSYEATATVTTTAKYVLTRIKS